MWLVKERFLWFLKDILWHYTLVALLFKSLLILGFVTGGSSVHINLQKAYDAAPSMLLYISFIILLLSFAFLFSGKKRFWFLVILNFTISMLMIFDIWYYRGFNTFLSVHQLQQINNLEGSLSSSVFSMSRAVDILFVFDIIILVFIGSFSKNPYRKSNRSIILFSLLIVFSASFITLRHYKVDILEGGSNQIQFRVCWAPIQTISNLSPIGYHLYDTYNYWDERRPLVLNDAEKDDIRNWLENRKENLPDNKYKGLFKGKNLLVIQVESLENFIIGKKINGQEITPTLNRLISNSLYFSNYYEQVNDGTSSDADLLTNTSVYPIIRGSTFFRYPSNTYNSLPLLLKNKGYATTAIHPDKGSFWNWMQSLTSIGFERCVEEKDFTVNETIGLGISDGSYFQQIAPMLMEMKQPFYTFMVTLTSHGPFDIPSSYRELKLDSKLDQTTLGGFFQSINYTDKQLGLFLEKLDKAGLLDNTVVAIHGDHTGIHKYYQDELEKIEPREEWWMDTALRVPLIIYSRGLQGEEHKVTGGQIDLLPTLAYLMDVQPSEYESTAMGRNLLNTSRDFAVLADGKVVGTLQDEKEKEQAIKGLETADKIIRSNYFKTK